MDLNYARLMSKTYSFGTTPMHEIANALPAKYAMSLNRRDMQNLLHVLYTYSADNDDPVGEWALGFRSDILQTIGIEEV